MDGQLNTRWSENMNQMLATYNDLLPTIYDAESFRDPKNQRDLEVKIARLNARSQFVTQHAGRQMSGRDPLYRVGIEGLQSRLDRSYQAYKAKDFDQSQALLKSSVNFCFQCHLSSESGFEIESWSAWKAPQGLSPLQEARVYGATRQFSKAQAALQTHVETSAHSGPQEKELLSTLKMMIQLALYRNQDPNQVAQSIVGVLQAPDKQALSRKTKQLLQAWEKDLKLFQPLRDEDQPTQLRKMLQQKSSLQDPEKQFVSVVRQSMILRRALVTNRFFDVKAKILYRLGLLYRQFPEEGMNFLSDEYFADCVRLMVASDLSKQCHQALQTNLLQRYQVKDPKKLPEHERKYLGQLEKLTRSEIRGIEPGFGYFGR
jgi:hypothetical protein